MLHTTRVVFQNKILVCENKSTEKLADPATNDAKYYIEKWLQNVSALNGYCWKNADHK